MKDFIAWNTSDAARTGIGRSGLAYAIVAGADDGASWSLAIDETVVDCAKDPEQLAETARVFEVLAVLRNAGPGDVLTPDLYRARQLVLNDRAALAELTQCDADARQMLSHAFSDVDAIIETIEAELQARGASLREAA